MAAALPAGKRWMRLILITLILVFLTCLIFWKINLLSFLLGREPMWDFDVYYQTAVDVRHGANPYQVPYMRTAGPPSVIIPYLPLSFLPLPVARSLMISASLVAAFASCWIVAKKLFSTQHLSGTLVLHFLLWLTFLPRFNLNVGQPNLILMWLITLTLTTQKPHLQGVMLALVTIIKTHYGITLAGFLKNQRRPFVLALFICVGSILACLPLLKPAYYQEYLVSRLSYYVVDTAPLANVDYYNQSLRSTLSRLHLESWYQPVILVLIVGGGYYLIKTADLAGGILLSLLISPIVWQHYLVVVYPIIVLTFKESWQREDVPWYFIFGSGLIFMHLPWLHDQPIELGSGILASHYYFGLLLLFLSRTRLPKLKFL